MRFVIIHITYADKRCFVLHFSFFSDYTSIIFILIVLKISYSIAPSIY